MNDEDLPGLRTESQKLSTCDESVGVVFQNKKSSLSLLKWGRFFVLFFTRQGNFTFVFVESWVKVTLIRLFSS